MGNDKTVFISYRRSASKHLARAIFTELRHHGYDVFLDVNTIDSGEFDKIILRQIAARTHFILVLSPGALDRCVNENDWLRREIEEALRLKRNIVPILEEGFERSREYQFLPDEWRDKFSRLNTLPLVHFYFDEGMNKLRNRYLKLPEYHIPLEPTPKTDEANIQRMIQNAVDDTDTDDSVLLPDVSRILPPPFEWVTIPTGYVTLEPGGYLNKPYTYLIESFSIAKYPITYGQYAVFIDSGGYDNPEWWTEVGWLYRQENNWKKPRYWADKNAKGRGADFPVSRLSWYEVIAFCNWLNNEISSGEQRKTQLYAEIGPPTEQQWQRAAQGDDARIYPWGNKFDPARCNTFESLIGKTTRVTHYSDTGSSPFGVSDMSGNVWEWCLTAYDSGANSIQGDLRRVVRGGSLQYNADSAKCTARDFSYPVSRNKLQGFRICTV